MKEEEALELAAKYDCVAQYQFFKIFLGMPPMEILVRLGIYEEREAV